MFSVSVWVDDQILSGVYIVILDSNTEININEENQMQQVVFVKHTEGQVVAIVSQKVMTGWGCLQTGGGL